jgi:hypothetical protein
MEKGRLWRKRTADVEVCFFFYSSAELRVMMNIPAQSLTIAEIVERPEPKEEKGGHGSGKEGQQKRGRKPL